MVMSISFGRLWEAQYGQVGGSAFDAWAVELFDFSDEEIDRGLNRTKKIANDRVLRGQRAYPPNLIEFRAFCRKKIKHPSHLPFLTVKIPSKIYENGAGRMAELRKNL